MDRESVEHGRLVGEVLAWRSVTDADLPGQFNDRPHSRLAAAVVSARYREAVWGPELGGI
ncbi:hypothetical protein [Actinacidiphila oryziradicis]|uniref:hypothetical protein n=1 Tax=Actinacidiphila oryziradicis TaxID=2571141 RepID=UPI00145D0FD3|nr:hypothetical protein [Actinacidiphila oryziradicis]